ncbi:MAG: tautomerase family protein [Pseudomonadota bacterium]|nr:tautomerase family protein [Pseudomonadota bacterium]
MPSTLISVRRHWPAAQRAQLIDSVHEAMVETLKVPARDRCLRLQEFAPEDFAVMPQCSEFFTLIEISLFAGRSLDAKRACYQALVQSLGELGVPAQDVRVILNEVPQDNWGIRGGHPASEVNLGFKIEV